MEPKYVLMLDLCVGCLNIIKLTDEELKESEMYEDFLSTIEEKYGFRLSNYQWMTTEELNICRYENGREVEDYA